MEEYSFSMFPNENFLDLTIYQYGWEQCMPLHSFGPYIRNHYLFHYISSGRGKLHSNTPDGMTRHYDLRAGQGFLLTPGQVNTYYADKQDPWKYSWIEFDGLRTAEYLDQAGLTASQPVFTPSTKEGGARVGDEMMYIATHSDASPLHLLGHLYLFLDALVDASATRREVKPGQLRDFYIQEAIHYIERNYRRELPVEEVADICKLNRSYFSKIFKEYTGCAPQAVQWQHRRNRGKMRLSQPAPLFAGFQEALRYGSARMAYTKPAFPALTAPAGASWSRPQRPHLRQAPPETA